MKKICLILLLALLAVSAPFAVASTSGEVAFAADLDYGTADTLFLQTVYELSYDDLSGEAISASKELLLDVDLNELGYVYDFEINDVHGFAIVINTDDGFEVKELFLDAENPYANLAGDYVYIGSSVYAAFDGQDYYIANAGCTLTREELDELFPSAYSAGEGFTYSTTSISYTYRSVNAYNMAAKVPSYWLTSLTNSCAPAAGCNIVAYYDRYKTNLITGYTPGTALGASYIYKTNNATTNSVGSQLYTDMGTNSIVDGTTETQFLNGMTAYCSRQGYTFGYTSCMSGSSINYQSAKQMIDSGKPIALFLDVYNITTIAESTNLDTYSIMVGQLNHMMVGFGYKAIDYTLSNGSHRYESFLAVSTGIESTKSGFFNVNSNATVNAAYGVTIS